MKALVLACVVWWFGAIAPAVAADGDMLLIEYQIVAFGVDPQSFAAMPRRLWRGGPALLRLEEPVNPATLEHRLVISALPDIWYIDLGSRQGVHGRDTSTSAVARFPVFLVEPGDPLSGLEMGKEAAFFAANGAHDAPDKPVAGVDCSVQQLDLGGRKLTLYRRKDDQVPVLVSIETGEHVLGVRYRRYEVLPSIDRALFAPPEGIVFEEKQ